jgi:hypothetical protein
MYSAIDARHQHTGRTRQIVAGVLQGPLAGLAICRYDEEVGFYLFGCDGHWNTITDTWHGSLEDAKEQAEWEYAGVTQTWQAM